MSPAFLVKNVTETRQSTKSNSIDGCFKYFSGKKNMSRNNTGMFMFVCTSVLYEYMNSLRNAVCNLFVNMHVRIKIYHQFYHCIIYIANEGRHVRILLSITQYKSVMIIVLQMSYITLIRRMRLCYWATPSLFCLTFSLEIYFQKKFFIISSLFPLSIVFVSIYLYNLMVATACTFRHMYRLCHVYYTDHSPGITSMTNNR
jgi:hypothetical protein